MLLVGLKRCAFYTQIRRLATLHINGRIQMNKKSMYHFTEYKYSNLSNPNLSVQRLCSTNPGKQREESLPPLMWDYRKTVIPSFLKLWISYFIIRGTIDEKFRLNDFLVGAKQAMVVISHALASQNYETLEDIVKDKTLKVLKHRVDHLTPKQRKLIAINPDLLFFMPGCATIRRQKELNQTIVEIEVNGIYMLEIPEMSHTLLQGWDKDVAFCCYKFQRTYKNGIGGSWIVRLANHLTSQ